MKPREIEALAKTLAPIVREHSEKRAAEMLEAFRETVDAQIKEMGERVGDIDIPVIDLEDIAKQAASLVPEPINGKDGEDGEKGDDGKKGDKGERGEKGDAGESVSIETVKSLIEDQLKSWQKPVDGRDGKDGKDGKDGRDALQQIDPDSIVGTLEGIAAKLIPAVDFDGERTLTITTPKIDGDPVVEKYILTIPMYREQWNVDKGYMTGDVVTCGGSMWSCKNDCTGDRPGGSDSWKLCVKKGRDGK